jgi:vWA-MoxR associated protein C-terminal domain/vWA-MoxR associated protein middle region 0/Effector-associated domain 2
MNGVVVGVKRELTLKEKKGLLTAFLRLPGMRDQERRKIYVEELSRQFPYVLTATRHHDSQSDVWSLLETCYELPGAVNHLLEIVSSFHQGHQWLGQLHAMVESFFPAALLLDSERARLIRLLGEVEVSTLAASYRYAAHVAFHEPPPDPTDVAAVVRRMEAHVGLPGRLPAMFEFADHAAHQSRRGIGADVHRWLDEVAVRLGFAGHAAINSMCEATRMRLTRQRRYYFAAQLVPDGVLVDRYLLSAWLQHDLSPEEPICRDDEAVPLSGAIERLYSLLRQVPDHIDDEIEELLVELILPRSLITRPVDQWQVDRELPHALGTARPLVVRSLDRLRRADLHATWGRKWRWLMVNSRHADISHFHDVDSYGQDAVSALRAMLLRGEPPVALVMRTPPPDSDDLCADVFTAGLYGGAPVMLWCRDSTMSEEFQEQIRERLVNGDLLGLPQRVFELRLLAAESVGQGRQHIGCHVTLLWDDFDRIPEPFRHRARARAPRPKTAGNS